MVRQPRFSVVLANFNGRDYLAECIESVLSQRHDDFEFVIVDDGSTDDSADIIARYVDREPRRLRLVRLAANAGQGAAFNRGLTETTGELVAFIDSDDVWFPDKLSTVAAEFGNPDVVAFHQHNLRIIQGTTPTDETFRATLAIGDVFGEAKKTRRPPVFVPTSGLTFARRALRQVGPIPDAFRTCADGFLTRTAMCFGRVSGSDVSCGGYRVHGANQTFDNPAFDSGKYLRELLLPKLNAFYQLRSIPLAFPIVATPETEPPQAPLAFLRLQTGDRLLVVRSAPVARVAQVLSSLFAVNPDIRIDLLVQPEVEASFTDPRISALALKAGPMRAESLSREVRQQVGRQDYVFVIVPYNEPDNRNYRNVHAVLQGLPVTCPMLGIGLSGTVFSIGDPAATAAAGRPVVAPPPAPDWESLRDCHKGRRAFIIGNGPSLCVSDLDRLKNEITFASNKIYLAFGDTDWRPTYYTVCDQMVAANNAERIRQLPLEMLLPTTIRKFNCAGSRTRWYEERFGNKFVEALSAAELEQASMVFAEDVGDGVQGGYTVIYHQLQLAYHMGIREVVLIGVDFSFQVPAERTVDTRFTSEVYRNAIVSHGERNHFHPDYRRPGETWTMPRLDLHTCAFRTARATFEQAGGRLVNASRRTALTVLTRVDFDELVS